MDFLLKVVIAVLAVLLVCMIASLVFLAPVYVVLVHIKGKKYADQGAETDYVEFLRKLVKGVKIYGIGGYILFLGRNYVFLWLTSLALFFLFVIAFFGVALALRG